MLDNPFSEVKFPNIQSKPPLAQLEAISSHPITCYLGEETNPHLSTTSFQAKQPHFPQLLLIRLLLQTLHQLRCTSLDTLQHLNVSLVVRGPKLNTVFEVRPHQCRVQGHNHFPSPAGHAISDTSQDAIGFLGHLGTLLAHIQAAVNQHPQVLFCQAAFQPLFPKPVALHGVAVAQVQDLALSLVKPHTIDLGPSIQPVQVPLQSLPTLKQINTPTQLGVVCKLTEGALDPLIQIIDKDVKQNWPQHRALGNTACDRPPTGVNSIHHHSLGPAIQPVLYPAKSTPVQAMSSQFLQENAVGNRVKTVSSSPLFSLEKRRLWGDLIAAFQYLKRAYKYLERDFLQGHVVIGQGTRYIRKKFFTIRVVRHWNRLPREVVDAPFPGSVQGQVRWGFEQPGLVEDYHFWKKGQTTQEEYRDLVKSCREKVRNAKAQLELNLAAVIIKKVFTNTLTTKREPKRISLLGGGGGGNGDGDIATKDEEKAEVLNAFFASVFNSQTVYPQGIQPLEQEDRDREQNKPP
ncbi:LOW QUALITY PROTEIN: hypothetical protein QYF61_011871 [Mycteria americana]|uniref:Uncharacterized protein n=1 Tax=Mycteria americana TaxID=33587 RepID=A0AAN7RZ70_MYCAM|nr:LOW QUALITY PROTEIN: hypothetical protein QYF61_011871 [Mycteria americana]